jgi:D-alanine-D-alanine ligase
MMEIAPADGDQDFVYSLEVKRDWRRRVCYHVPPRLGEADRIALACRALQVYRLLGCRDVARLDFRMDDRGEACFLECNPLPGLNPESGDLAILSRDILPYEKLVQGILRDAALRYGVPIP